MSVTTLKYLGALVLAGVTLGVPVSYYRLQYDYAKRFRIVTPDRVYRSGQLAAGAFRELVQQHGIRTVINVQNETPNPNLGRIDEATLLQELGVRYVFIDMDLLERHRIPAERPAAIAAFLKVMDDPSSYPVLIHCKAGLHRTGTLVALYRLEYEGVRLHEALGELVDNGFSPRQATARNDYIKQYLLTYQPRPRSETTLAADAHRKP